MPSAANDYAIGPGLYDWERDQWEKEEMRRDAMEAAIENEAEDRKDYFVSITFPNKNVPNKNDREYIEVIMDEAMTVIADQGSEQFNRWLWQVWACKSRNDQGRTEQALIGYALEQLMKTLDSAITQVFMEQAKSRINAA